MDTKKPPATKNGISPVTAAVTGAVIGAGVAVAGAMALKDKKNRDQVKKILTNVKDHAAGFIEEAQKQAKNVAKHELAEGKARVKDAGKAVKDSLHKK